MKNNMNEWKEVNSGRVMMLNGNGNHAVFPAVTPKGVLWVFNKRSAYSPSLKIAMDWVETLAELQGSGIGYTAAITASAYKG